MRSVITSGLGLWLLFALPAAAQHVEPQQNEETPSQEDTLLLEQAGEESGTDSEPAPPEDDDDAVTYSGYGLTRVSADFENLKDAVNLGFTLGLRVPTINWISAEFNLDFTIIPGENTGPRGTVSTGGTPCTIPPSPLDPDGTPNGCDTNATTVAEPGRFTDSGNDLQMQNVGAFLVMRSPGKFYAMGKYGYRYQNTSIDEIQEGGDKSGSGYGAGLGYRWGKGLSGVELQYTRYSEDLDYLGLNIAYGFGAKSDRRR